VGLQASISKHTLVFKRAATTSRGSYNERTIYLLEIWNKAKPDIKGIGECAPLAGLSIDDVPEYEAVLQVLVKQINANKSTDSIDFNIFPSIKFGLETALLDLKYGGNRIIFQNFYAIGKQGLPINGLIWMNEISTMKEEIVQKMAHGFECIKIKIGALDFDEECKLLEFVRQQKGGDKLILRTDANGAFEIEDALLKLKELRRFNLHSIEQPIKKGVPEAMAELISKSPVPIALDEELIGISKERDIFNLLKSINPSYIVLKPNLLGGFIQTDVWIKNAQKLSIGYWITSALESNIGLNAIAQYTANLNIGGYQGLGTGHLYLHNFKPNTNIKHGYIWRDMGTEVSDNSESPYNE
jgi:o-succinylbenzoate synthase